MLITRRSSQKFWPPRLTTPRIQGVLRRLALVVLRVDLQVRSQRLVVVHFHLRLRRDADASFVSLPLSGVCKQALQMPNCSKSFPFWFSVNSRCPPRLQQVIEQFYCFHPFVLVASLSSRRCVCCLCLFQPLQHRCCGFCSDEYILLALSNSSPLTAFVLQIMVSKCLVKSLLFPN